MHDTNIYKRNLLLLCIKYTFLHFVCSVPFLSDMLVPHMGWFRDWDDIRGGGMWDCGNWEGHALISIYDFNSHTYTHIHTWGSSHFFYLS